YFPTALALARAEINAKIARMNKGEKDPPDEVRIALATKKFRDRLAAATTVDACETLKKDILQDRFLTVEKARELSNEVDAVLDKLTATPASDKRAEITFLYQKILGRNPDAGGLDWWEKQYAEKGISGIAKEFIQSKEFKGKSRSDQIAALYRTILRREPDAGGLEWHNKSGKSLDAIAAEMINADEFKKLDGSHKTFVTTKVGLPDVLK
ncbi:MAG: DUF4214 domain-containing protein, partial [Acidobacteriota bacterium]